jgi:hypothetical protein
MTIEAYAALERLAEQNGIKNSWWSVEGIEAEDLTRPHPYVGATHVVYTTDSFFAGADAGEFSAVIEGATWLDLWKAADQVIRAGGDAHHLFIERFDPHSLPHLTLHTGS